MFRAYKVAQACNPLDTFSSTNQHGIHPPRPSEFSETLSETDRERIRDPEYIWLLTPVVNSKATGTFGFEVKKDKDSKIFINLAVEIVLA